jgi:excisionase family DNA binding protein
MPKTAVKATAAQQHQPMLSIIDVAEEWNVHPRTVWREIQRRRLRATKVAGEWRISRKDAAAYISANENT